MRRVSSWMRVASSGGIFAGPRMPTQATDSNPGSTSAIAGTSGSAGLRSRLATPSARILPAWIGDMTAVIWSKANATWPPIRSLSSGPVPL